MNIHDFMISETYIHFSFFISLSEISSVLELDSCGDDAGMGHGELDKWPTIGYFFLNLAIQSARIC